MQFLAPFTKIVFFAGYVAIAAVGCSNGDSATLRLNAERDLLLLYGDITIGIQSSEIENYVMSKYDLLRIQKIEVSRWRVVTPQELIEENFYLELHLEERTVKSVFLREYDDGRLIAQK